MEDIRSVLSQFYSKKKKDPADTQGSSHGTSRTASISEIPDVFFDVVLHEFKLNRHEIMILMTLYRQVWCRPNLYKVYGIGPLNSYSELCTSLSLSNDELGTYLRTLENYGLIETIRFGQYFVRKYFTEDLDQKFAQKYDESF